MYNNDWLVQNSYRKYPFMHECTLRDETKKFILSNSVIVDAIFHLNIGYQYQLYLSKILHSPEYLSLTFSINGEEALTGTSNETGEFFTINLEGKNDYEGSIGKVIIGSLTDLPYGEYSFLVYDTRIEPCRIIRLYNGINSLNGIRSGNVTLSSRSNVNISKDGNIIYIDSQDGLCACNTLQCIKTINGIYSENFIIDSRGCIAIEDIDGGIRLINNCEQACCGCDEINDFIDRINELERRITALESLG